MKLKTTEWKKSKKVADSEEKVKSEEWAAIRQIERGERAPYLRNFKLNCDVFKLTFLRSSRSLIPWFGEPSLGMAGWHTPGMLLVFVLVLVLGMPRV